MRLEIVQSEWQTRLINVTNRQPLYFVHKSTGWSLAHGEWVCERSRERHRQKTRLRFATCFLSTRLRFVLVLDDNFISVYSRPLAVLFVDCPFSETANRRE